jgi:hypothetical protein
MGIFENIFFKMMKNDNFLLPYYDRNDKEKGTENNEFESGNHKVIGK